MKTAKHTSLSHVQSLQTKLKAARAEFRPIMCKQSENVPLFNLFLAAMDNDAVYIQITAERT